MQLNTEDTYELLGLIEQKKPPIPFYMNRFFSDTLLSEKEEVIFEDVIGERRMAPFVSPMVEGRVIRSKGSAMKAFKPAYVKPKMVVEPGKMLKRLPGETLGGQLSPEQRKNLTIVQQFRDQDEMIDNRLEWMCLQAIKNGSITVSGEDYPIQLVDFGRDPGLTITVGTPWSSGAATPLTDLRSASTAMAAAPHGALGVDVFMTALTYGYFSNNDEVIDKLDTNFRGTSSNVNRDPTAFSTEDAPRYMGTTGDFNIWVDARQYEDDNGLVQKFLDDEQVSLTSPMVNGAQCFGAILDDDVLRAVRSWAKTWVKQDPSVRYTMTQSAPLPVPRRINGTALLDVL